MKGTRLIIRRHTKAELKKRGIRFRREQDGDDDDDDDNDDDDDEEEDSFDVDYERVIKMMLTERMKEKVPWQLI